MIYQQIVVYVRLFWGKCGRTMRAPAHTATKVHNEIQRTNICQTGRHKYPAVLYTQVIKLPGCHFLCDITVCRVEMFDRSNQKPITIDQTLISVCYL